MGLAPGGGIDREGVVPEVGGRGEGGLLGRWEVPSREISPIFQDTRLRSNRIPNTGSSLWAQHPLLKLSKSSWVELTVFTRLMELAV